MVCDQLLCNCLGFTMFIISCYSKINAKVRAVIITIVLMCLYIERPLMNMAVDMFKQTSGNGNFSRYGHFLKITIRHESQNRSCEVKNIDDCAYRAGNSTVATDTTYCCEDYMDDESITYVMIRAIHVVLLLCGVLLVCMSAAFLGKRKNIQFEAVVTLGLCIECVMIVCYILFATVVANSLGFSTADLTTFFYSTTVITACLLTLTFCTLAISVVSGRKLPWSNDDNDKSVKPLMQACKT
ncbi:uncharacterized protein LOC127863394 [Dreissena polymorpha]|uniref:Uncharacterized protein n=1 Tax=Dreissena polymorpha TaxID=45954 RepID=A0A9D4BF37_DREPO|nr:uncharacterized protein LOC127863394 [Dreissena polymorpha]KAH3692388.1 hypothetical protein DPMN_194838 [Dreissena polymorpha]